MSLGKKIAAAGLAVIGAAALWWRRNPSACPYNQRFWIQAPHPFITRGRLMQTLAPRPGERVLEIGPGTGYYSLEVARALQPGGTLEIFDLQQEMLDHTMDHAGEAGITNLIPTRGDARELPYESASFDSVFLVTVLGEIPDRSSALREIRRVLKPEGRLVVGELFGDPHMVTLKTLQSEAQAAGFSFVERIGPKFGYFARFGVT